MTALAAVKCVGDEQLEQFGFVTSDDLTSDAAKEALGLKAGIRLPVDGKSGLRLDVCFGSKGGMLRQIVWTPGEGKAPEAIAVGSDAKVENLEDALFGDESALRVRVPLSGGRAFFLEGRTGNKAGGETFPYAVAGVFEKDGKAVEGGSVLLGNIGYGNTMPEEGACRTGAPASSFVEFDSVRIDFDVCIQTGTSGGFAYDIARLTVTDSNASLSKEERAPFELVGDALGKAVSQKFNHHNACDSIRIETPHAVYALTASTMPDESKCGGVVPDAPQLVDGAASGAFRLRRKGGSWTEGKASFRHFVQDNVKSR